MILVLDCGSSKVCYIEDLIDYHCDYKTVPILDFEISDLDGVNGVVISGAPLLITEIDMTPFLNKIEWIKESALPVLGICFGHQLIGLLYGAFASRMSEDRDWQLVEFFEDSILNKKLSNEVKMMEDHCETISIPSEFNLLASSDACINEAMKHKTKDIYGVQFHPETSGNSGSVLMGNFVERCMKS